MDAVFFLRSYGDFVVAMYTLRGNSNAGSLQLYASRHLEPLHAALPEDKPEVCFFDIGIRRGILGGFTNKHFATVATLRELFTWRKWIKQLPGLSHTYFYLEQWRRKWLASLFAGKHFRCVHNGGNIYHSYSNFSGGSSLHFASPQIKPGDTILVFPDSRKTSKALPAGIVSSIRSACDGVYNVAVAQFGTPEHGTIEQDIPKQYYNSFEALVKLVRTADFIISSDSLPAHLAQLCQKPHWVIYPRTVNHEWLTPHAASEKHYCCFDEMEKLKSFLTGTA